MVKKIVAFIIVCFSFAGVIDLTTRPTGDYKFETLEGTTQYREEGILKVDYQAPFKKDWGTLVSIERTLPGFNTVLPNDTEQWTFDSPKAITVVYVRRIIEQVFGIPSGEPKLSVIRVYQFIKQ